MVEQNTGVVELNISIIVVAWNNRDELRECLSSLNSQLGEGIEVIVIDNCSSDGTTDMVRTDYPGVIIQVMDSNLGFAEGCNRGIEIAQGDWLCTLNSDVVAEPNWVATIGAAIDNAGPNVGMFQSKVLFKKNPDRVNSTGIVLLATGGSGDRDFNAPNTTNDEVEEIFVPSASAAVYRKTMLLEARLESGIFDRTFFMYAEDLDLGWRCRLMGWKAYYLPGAIVVHSYQSSSKKWGNKWADLQCRKNRVRALIKNGSIVFLITTIPKTVYDFFLGLRHSGFMVFIEFYKAMRDGISQRKNVSRLLTESRRDIEKKWVTKALRINSQSE